MGSVRDDQLIYEYLGKVADAAHGKLPSLARQELVEKVRHEIEDRRRKAGRTDITRVLQSMGDPRLLVARAVHEGGGEYAGYRPPMTASSVGQPAPAGPLRMPVDNTQPLPTVMPVTEADTATVPAAAPVAGIAPAAAAALYPPSSDPYGPPGQPHGVTTVGVVAPERLTEVIRRRMTPSGPMTWLRTRRSAEPTQVWRDASGTGEYPERVGVPTTFQPVSAAKTWGIEVAALFALTVGALWIPYLGWLVGLALVMASRSWSIRDKGIAVALIPALTLGGGIFYVWLTVGRDRPAGVGVADRFENVSGYIVGVFKVWPIMAALLAATWLMSQLLARWAGAQRERWK